MSPNGHIDVAAPSGATAMVVGSGVLDAGTWFPPHAHPQHQLAWSASGVITVGVAEQHWVLPPTRALWIPGGVVHRTGSTEGAAMRGIYVEPQRSPARWHRPTMIAVSALLRELFEYLGSANVTEGRRRRAEAVVFDLLEPVEVIPIVVPIPTDPRARAVAESVLREPGADRPIGEFAARAHMSERTLARLFRTETGVAFGRWRTHARLSASLTPLAEGLPVAAVARRVGYATSSAFVAAFRREVGVSPGRYFR